MITIFRKYRLLRKFGMKPIMALKASFDNHFIDGNF